MPPVGSPVSARRIRATIAGLAILLA